VLAAADEEQLNRVVAIVREVLGPDALGAYLLGSAVLGSLRRESDLDVLAVTSRATTREEKQRLVDPLLRSSGLPRRIELTLVVQADVKPWRYPPRMDFQYGDWLRAEFERGELDPPPTNSDLAVLLTMVLLGDAPVFGPPPAELLDPVPHDDVARAMRDGIPALLADLDDDTRNVLLTLARIWSTLATGVIRSKDAAADWALPRLPEEHRAVLTRARAIYLGEEEERWDDLRRRVRRHADHVVAEINRL
jgi:streptomycin 3"-adenylyltransferase